VARVPALHRGRAVGSGLLERGKGCRRRSRRVLKRLVVANTLYVAKYLSVGVEALFLGVPMCWSKS
jgi:hypothetical protein